MTSLYLVLARYKLVRFGPCTCLPSIYVQNLPTALLSAVVWRLAFFRPISWLPSFPAILLCHSYRNDLILLNLFRIVIYSFPQWLNIAIGFPTYGLLCPFCFFSWASLAHLLPLGFLIPFTNYAFPWAITTFIGLPWPNYFILILGVHGLGINPLLSLFALLLGLQWLILTFSTSHTAHGYAISLFPGFSKLIYLLKAHLFISWTYDPSFLTLGPDGFATCLPNLCCPCCWAFCLPVGSSKMTFNNDKNTPET